MKKKQILSVLSVILGCLLLFACTTANNTQATESGSAESADPNVSAEAPESGFTVGEQPEGAGQPPQGMPEPPQGWSSEGQPPAPPEGMGNPPQGEPTQGGPGGQPPQGGPGGPGGSAADVSYTAATEITAAETQSGKTYSSTAANENALLIATSDAVAIENPTVAKTGDSDGGDACNFYGLNAGVLCKDGAQVTITGGTVETSASGANGVFCYGGNGGRNGAAGDGTTVTISDTVITTTGSGSGGIMTTGGGKTIANNLTITTSGQSSAPIRTDRGGGTVLVDGGTYTSNGLGSPRSTRPRISRSQTPS